MDDFNYKMAVIIIVAMLGLMLAYIVGTLVSVL